MSTGWRQLITLVEQKGQADLKQAKLPYARDKLDPVLSQSTLDYHYGKLYKGYVDKYNSGEGDADFNEAGAFLHEIYFTQLMPPANGNKPAGAISALINEKFGSFVEFQKEFTGEAMKIQGSGWIYLSRNGQIKTIKNHQIKRDIALLVDWWEHSWALDYQSDKAGYLKNIWRCIDWDKVNSNLQGENK